MYFTSRCMFKWSKWRYSRIEYLLEKFKSFAETHRFYRNNVVIKKNEDFYVHSYKALINTFHSNYKWTRKKNWKKKKKKKWEASISLIKDRLCTWEKFEDSDTSLNWSWQRSKKIWTFPKHVLHNLTDILVFILKWMKNNMYL